LTKCPALALCVIPCSEKKEIKKHFEKKMKKKKSKKCDIEKKRIYWK